MRQVFAALFVCVFAGLPAGAEEPDGLVLPPGFHATVVADGLTGARHMAIRDNGDIYVSTRGAKELGIIALRAQEKIAARNLAIIRENLGIAERFFAEHAEHLTWIAPRAGSIAFPMWRGASAVEQFCAEMVEQFGVMIVPGSIFDFPGNHFRLGLGRKNFGEAIGKVKAYLH